MASGVPDLAGAAAQVAPALLGCALRHGGVTIRLTEVEAYSDDTVPASHAYRGRTPRTQIMFGPPGHLYVYFVYGMHWCANIVTGPDGVAGAVLLRGGEVIAGEDIAAARRPGVGALQWARGPAGLARSLGLTGTDTGSLVDLQGPPTPMPADRICIGPRVGIRVAVETPWRFWLVNEPSVSAYRVAVARRRTGGSKA